MIFVSIVSYREPKLVETVLSCVNQAYDRSNIRVGVLWQYDESENTSLLDNIDSVYVYKLPYRESKGSCVWAREKVQREIYDGEDYYLQVDAHSIFAKDWDTKLLNIVKYQIFEKRWIITAPPPFYYDSNQEKGSLKEHHPDDPTEIWSEYEYEFSTEVQWNRVVEINQSGYFGFYPTPATQLKSITLSRQYHGNFIFAPRLWVEEVPYDIHAYFTAIEQIMNIRTFTAGYNMYCPNDIIVYHQKYWFPGKKRHNNDFDLIKEGIEDLGYEKLRHWGGMQKSERNWGNYDLGNRRTMEDWEIYTGIALQDQVIHPDALIGIPPNPVTVKDLNWWRVYKDINKGKHGV